MSEQDIKLIADLIKINRDAIVVITGIFAAGLGVLVTANMILAAALYGNLKKRLKKIEAALIAAPSRS